MPTHPQRTCSNKRDLVICQKRPTHMPKETYSYAYTSTANMQQHRKKHELTCIHPRKNKWTDIQTSKLITDICGETQYIYIYIYIDIQTSMLTYIHVFVCMINKIYRYLWYSKTQYIYIYILYIYIVFI